MIPPLRLAAALLILVLIGLLAGCGATIVPVRVPMPVECREELPERSGMPAEHLQPGAGLDAFVQAATADIERREGYEGRLRMALEACTRPLAGPAPSAR